jgi:hypothetical protein
MAGAKAATPNATGTPNVTRPPKDSTAAPREPFPLQSGGSGFIAPLPASSEDAAPEELSSVLFAGPFSSFLGEDLNANTPGQGEPPDVSADVSSSQNVEFINNIGLAVWNKPALPVPSPAPTPAITDPVTFWCGSNGVNGQPLLGCSSGIETAGNLTDTQVGYDASLGRWIATELVRDPNDGIGFIYLAASAGSQASGWEKWSDDACLVNPALPVSDQPLLGWSNNVIIIDIVCATSVENPLFGPDELHIIPNTSITSSAPSLPLAVQAPCPKMVPARDEQGSFSSAYLLAPIVPGPGDPAGNVALCAPNIGNTEPYVVEYTATTAGVFGSGGACMAGASCTPVSTSPQWGNPGFFTVLDNAKQLGCSTADCEILVGDARITAAQIRPSSIGSSTSQSPVLVGGFATGIDVTGSSDESQNLWFIQNVSTGSWLNKISEAGGGDWFAYPTIAIDNDQDLYLGGTHFSAGIYPETNWQAYEGIGTGQTLVANGVTEISGGTYTGDPDESFQRWGDYNTMIYDPLARPPGGEGSWWSVEEISQGGSDESTKWEALADPTPLPYFVGSNLPATPKGNNGGENECSAGAGSPCNLIYSAPSGAQFGDVLIVIQCIGDQQDATTLTVPSGWTKLKFQNGSHTLYSTDGTFTSSFYVALYVYGSQPNDTGQYEFSIVPQGNTETDGFLVGYRGASPTIPGNYLLYGNAATTDTSQVSTLKLSPSHNDAPPAETTLFNLFSQNCIHSGSEEPDFIVDFGAVSGSPAVTAKTPLSSSNGNLAADVEVPVTGGTYGPYTSALGCSGINTGISLVIPE